MKPLVVPRGSRLIFAAFVLAFVYMDPDATCRAIKKKLLELDGYLAYHRSQDHVLCRCRRVCNPGGVNITKRTYWVARKTALLHLT